MSAFLLTTQAVAESDSTRDSAVSSSEHPPNYWLPALEIVLGYSAGTLWYVIDDRNVLDWDRPSAAQRFNGDAWRFDNNTFAMNFFGHPLSGSGAYLAGRSNRLGVWSSWGYSLAGSTLWEVVVEFKERVSINDMVITPGAGLPVGEFFHKLSQYVTSHEQRNSAQDVASWTFGFSTNVHRAYEGIPAPRAPELDYLGYDARYWHDFQLSYGLGSVTAYNAGPSQAAALASDGDSHRLGVAGALVTYPGYRTASAMSGWFWAAEFSSLDLQFDWTGGDFGADIRAETLAVGYHAARTGVQSNVATTAGLAVAYQYRDSHASGWDDRRAFFNAPGLAMDVAAFRGWLASELSLRFFPSLGGISAPNFSHWEDDLGGRRTKTVLERHGYFYAAGWTLQLGGAVEAGPVRLGADTTHGCYHSIQGLDRSQERVQADPALRECVREFALGVELTPADWGGKGGTPSGLEASVALGFASEHRASQALGDTLYFDGERALIEGRLAF